jgi:PAB-dependent poly(A)-specific ribonuclease subunit 3
VFVYDYHPNSIPLSKRYFKLHQPTIAEKVLWSFAVQIVSALKSIHSAGLACRTLDLSKILLCGKNRIRINCVGMLDLIDYEANADLIARQVKLSPQVYSSKPIL